MSAAGSHSAIRAHVERTEALRKNLAQIDAIPTANRVLVRLDRAFERLASPIPEQAPFQVVLIGGTGAGKSRLFSTLIGQPDASLSCDAERCFTRQPVAAVHPEDRALAALPAETVYVNRPHRGLLLIDTPDINGVLAANRDTTQPLIEGSDLVVFVAEPDRRADFDLHKEIREWAVRKRWFFAMNKMDLYESNAEAIRRDFDRRLRHLGFRPDSRSLFLVSALHPDRYEFAKLREAILQP